MKIFICCSKHFYDKISDIKEKLEKAGHEIILPNSYEEPFREERIKSMSKEKHIKWKGEMIKGQKEKVSRSDAIFVLNYDKNGIKNYIGGATFLEMYQAWEIGKKIYLLNEIPEGILRDEICAFNPRIMNGRLEEIV